MWTLAVRCDVPELVVGGHFSGSSSDVVSPLLGTAERQCALRRGASVLRGECQPAAVGVTRSLIDGSV